jgi:hypothetical protein
MLPVMATMLAAAERGEEQPPAVGVVGPVTSPEEAAKLVPMATVSSWSLRSRKLAQALPGFRRA